METNDAKAFGHDDAAEDITGLEKRRMAYAARGELGLKPKTLVITTHSMAAVGIFPSTMTITGVFFEDEEHKQAIIEAAAAFCEAVTGYPPSEVSFKENKPRTTKGSVH